jgi:hypothetical protein
VSALPPPEVRLNLRCGANLTRRKSMAKKAAKKKAPKKAKKAAKKKK